MSRQGHRPHSPTRRSISRRSTYTPAEWALVRAAAAATRLRPGAFIAKAAVGAARTLVAQHNGAAVRTSDELQQLIDEVRELRRVQGNVSGNLNDVARHANSTGVLGDNADAVLAYTRRLNERIDAWLIDRLRQGAL